MIRPAPAMRAPWITACPTPPQPMTATLLPGSTRAVLSAAPTPVVTPQPMSASCSSGTSVSTRTTQASCTVIWSANVPRAVRAMALLPSARVALGRKLIWLPSSQRFDCPCRQKKHAPQAGTNDAMTRSPTATRLTSGPTHSTVPAPSWPRMHGGGMGSAPLVTETSEWHTPLAPIRTMTSRGPGSTGVTSSTDRSGEPTKIAARMTSPPVRTLGWRGADPTGHASGPASTSAMIGSLAERSKLWGPWPDVAYNIADLFEHTVDAVPDRVCIIDRRSVADLRRARRAGEPDRPLPGRPGRRARTTTSAIYAQNSHQWLEAMIRLPSRSGRSRSTSTSATSRTSSPT